jgi:hypothetical protein
MPPTTLADFTHVWFVDFEFGGADGNTPVPICVVASEWQTSQTIRWWLDTPHRPALPPYACDQHNLFVAYFASAEMGCHLALNWPLPS